MQSRLPDLEDKLYKDMTFKEDRKLVSLHS